MNFMTAPLASKISVLEVQESLPQKKALQREEAKKRAVGSLGGGTQRPQ